MEYMIIWKRIIMYKFYLEEIIYILKKYKIKIWCF
jgi:hypothetical protein